MHFTGNFIEYRHWKLNFPFQAKICKILHNIVLRQVYQFSFIDIRWKFRSKIYNKFILLKLNFIIWIASQKLKSLFHKLYFFSEWNSGSCPLFFTHLLEQIIFKREKESLASSLLNKICRQNWYQSKSDYMDRALI